VLVIAAYTVSGGGAIAIAGASLAGSAAVVLAVALLFRVPGILPWAIALAGAGYVVGRAHATLVDGFAPVVGAALLLAAELASWSIDDDRRIHEDRALVLRQLGTTLGLVAGAAVVGFVLVGAASVSAASGLALTAVGVVAAVSAVAVVLRLLR